MQVKIQKHTLVFAAAVMMAVASVTLTPRNAVAQNGEEMFDTDRDGVIDAMDVCPDTVIPEQQVPHRVLLPGRYTLTDDDTRFNTHRGRESSFTLNDTRGCSCEQMIEMSGLSRSHRRFGCSRDMMRAFMAAVQAAVPAQDAPQCNTGEGEPVPEVPLY